MVKNDKWVIEVLDKKYIGRIPNMYIYFTSSNKLTRVTKEEIRKAIKHLTYDNAYKKIEERKQQCNTVVGLNLDFKKY